MKLNKLNILISFFITTFILEFNAVTFRTILDNQYEHLPNLFGFPFVYKTSIPWVNSFEQDIYINGLLGDLLILSLFFYILLLQLNRFSTPKILKKTGRIIIIAFGIISILSFFLNPIESKTFIWKNSFDMRNSKKQIEFFSTSNEKF